MDVGRDAFNVLRLDLADELLALLVVQKLIDQLAVDFDFFHLLL